MIIVHAQPAFAIEGVSRQESPELPAHDPLRRAEIVSIRRFIEAQRNLFRGRVLDYGAGKRDTCREPQPYRHLIEHPDVTYLPYDRGDILPATPFNVILCTQVLQYVADPFIKIAEFAQWLRPVMGTLVLTYPTNWAECEQDDLWRFTKAGMERMLARSGFQVIVHERRAEVRIGAFHFPLGYGVVAVAR